MPDKKVEDAKKQVAAEVKQLAKKIDQTRAQREALQDEHAELTKKAAPTPEEKKRTVDLRNAIVNLHKTYETEAQQTARRISGVLKTAVPNDQKALPEYQKGMEKWYRDFVEKEPGLDLGNGMSLTGDMSIKDKQANIYLNGKF